MDGVSFFENERVFEIVFVFLGRLVCGLFSYNQNKRRCLPFLVI